MVEWGFDLHDPPFGPTFTVAIKAGVSFVFISSDTVNVIAE